jgi:polar amino acid transport system substrate-binding protein
MKSHRSYAAFLLLAISAAACARLAPDPVWDRVEASGRIVIGTSADYAPFESYDEAFQITGFDAAIARELGTRLGLEVDLVDIAFDGLMSALEIGQIDAAIAAITVSPEREAVVDFTDVYFSGRDSALADDSAAFGPFLVPAQLAPYRVGVQRGTVYQTWLQTQLVDTGLMPAANLLVYEKPEHAVSDLTQGRNDVVVMDGQPADEYLLAGGVRLVGQSLNPQQFAIALPEGAATLQKRLNDALADMRNDGTLARFAALYLLIDDYEVQPGPTPTPLPGPTATPPACYDGMEFVEDVTVPDGTEMQPGQNFDKVWRVKNTGTCEWTTAYKVTFVQGDQMGGETEFVKASVSSGASYEVTIDWRLRRSCTYGGVREMRNAMPPRGAAVGRNRVPGAPQRPNRRLHVPPVQPPARRNIEYRVAEPTSSCGLITVTGLSGESPAPSAGRSTGRWNHFRRRDGPPAGGPCRSGSCPTLAVSSIRVMRSDGGRRCSRWGTTSPVTLRSKKVSTPSGCDCQSHRTTASGDQVESLLKADHRLLADLEQAFLTTVEIHDEIQHAPEDEDEGDKGDGAAFAVPAVAEPEDEHPHQGETEQRQHQCR